MNITVINSRKYDFTDEKTNKKINGIKISYIFNDDFAPVVVDANEKGYQVAEGTLTLDKEPNLQQVPGVYEAAFITRVNAKGQAVQKLLDIRYVSTVPELYVKK
ncbi:hypothetical protein [Sedimentibacter sp.]|uniref:hypothetical protein n=1 Tax=Sedimentibacter sp. TaxID=1960295 RepID=UPI000EC2439B|nr:hypothetical protein [Sedimentibacter sp.]HCX61318.1 hypothetical protein [Clostridiales bacterium]